MSRLQVGGLALILNSIYQEMVGRTCKLIHHVGIHKSSKTGTTADSWQIGVDGETYLIRSDWLMPLGDQQTQDELAKEKELENG